MQPDVHHHLHHHLTLMNSPQGCVSKGGNTKTGPTLRDAALRAAPQGEVGLLKHSKLQGTTP
jgi:hypothetical protein